MVPDRLWYRTDRPVRCCPLSCPGSASCPAISSVISGELQARGNSICLCLTGVLS
jgi:hypothetical protein